MPIVVKGQIGIYACSEIVKIIYAIITEAVAIDER